MASVFQDFNPYGLFTPAQPGTQITRGSLISFNYPRSLGADMNAIHDGAPMVVITDVKANYIRGVNLHYLTVPYVKDFLLRNAHNTNLTYQTSIKQDKYLSDSFRMYYLNGMQQRKKLDMSFLLQLLTAVRSFSPQELERIRNELRQQIQQRMQIKAAELNSYTEWQNKMRLQQLQQLQSQNPNIMTPPPAPTPTPQPQTSVPVPPAPMPTQPQAATNQPNVV